MKKTLLKAIGSDKSFQKTPDDILGKWIEGIKAGDVESAAKMYLFCRDITESVAYDVLKDARLAKEASWETMELIVRLLRKGVDTGEFEPWLMWMARNVAISYLQIINKDTNDTVRDFYKSEFNVDEDNVIKEVKREREIKKTTSKADVKPLVLLKGNRERNVMSWDPPEASEEVMPQREDQCETLRRKMKEYNFNHEHSTQNEAVGCSEELNDIGELKNAYSFKRTVKKKKNKTEGLVKNIIMTAVCTLLLWVVLGLLAKNTGFNLPDLGYSWFNTHMFTIF